MNLIKIDNALNPLGNEQTNSVDSVLHEKLPVPQLVKKFPVICGLSHIEDENSKTPFEITIFLSLLEKNWLIRMLRQCTVSGDGCFLFRLRDFTIVG
jgi:hypothetical protein